MDFRGKLSVLVGSIAIVLLVATPALGHSPAEQRAWERDWVTQVRAHGLTRSLLTEYVDFQERHVPRSPAPRPSTYRGIGSGVEKWRDLVAAYFPTEVDRALCIMSHESGGNPNAKNPSSGAAGLFQIMPFWWDKYGGDRFDPETNVRVAAAIRAAQGWIAWSPYKRGACR